MEAEILVSEASKLENKKPSIAIQKYLKAAQIYLTKAKQQPKNENKFVNEASILYMKAQSLKRKKAINKPSIRLLDNTSISKGETSFDDIGGLDEVKKQVSLKIIEPLRRPGLFQKYGKKPGGGVLMYGPPGCGKTLIAKASAGEAKVPFFDVKPSSFMSKWVGETEQNITKFFETARQSQPSITFFDEFESLGHSRSKTNSVHSGFVSQLLTEIDGVGSSDQQILFIAATNEPWLVDPALKREGRFGEKLFIPPPDFNARRSIFEIHLKEVYKDDIDFDLLADCTEGLTGADIKSVCTKAIDIVINEAITYGKERPLMMKDFAPVLKNIESTATPWFQKAMNYIKKNNAYEEYGEVVEYLKSLGGK